MRGLSFGRGLIAAVEAYSLSLTAWPIGMYGFLALAYFVVFRDALRTGLEVNSVEFWLMMQIGMICGCASSYPVNGWLIRRGIKEKMSSLRSSRSPIGLGVAQ